MLKKLTSREVEVLKLICKGETNFEIASKLFISVHTVKVHIEAILFKTKTRNRTHIAYLCGKNNII